MGRATLRQRSHRNAKFKQGRIYQGIWGMAPFQFYEEVSSITVRDLPLMPEWFLFIGAFAVFSTLVSILWLEMISLPLLVILGALPPIA